MNIPDYTLWGLPVILSDDVPKGEIRFGSADGPTLIRNLKVPPVIDVEAIPVVNGECDHCGARVDVTLTVDPFLRDLYPELPNEPSWWCEACLEKRRDDI